MLPASVHSGCSSQGIGDSLEHDGNVERPGQSADQHDAVVAYGLSGLDQAAIPIGPAAQEAQPVLKDHTDELRVDLAGNPPGLLAAPLVNLGVLLPKLEEEFDLPAHSDQHQRLLKRQEG